MPRSALHALHARVDAVSPDAWEDPTLVQVWGPRYVVYVVPAGEHLPFTLGRLPEAGRLRERAEEIARRLEAHLDGRTLPMDPVAEALGVGHPNTLRYASLTGTVLIRWAGARQPWIRTVPRAVEGPAMALQQLVRRYLHFLGPSTIEAFVRWAGVDAPAAVAAFENLAPALLAVRTPLGEAWILAEDEAAARAQSAAPAAARLLPSGDPYYLLWGAERDLVVPDPRRRDELWTSRVWPGALLVGGEIAGTWRRAKTLVDVTPWRQLSTDDRAAIEQEASSLPLPDAGSISVRWTQVE